MEFRSSGIQKKLRDFATVEELSPKSFHHWAYYTYLLYIIILLSHHALLIFYSDIQYPHNTVLNRHSLHYWFIYKSRSFRAANLRDNQLF